MKTNNGRFNRTNLKNDLVKVHSVRIFSSLIGFCHVVIAANEVEISTLRMDFY